MSTGLVSAALRQRMNSRRDKLILIAFCEHANDDGLSWPSVDLVAAEAMSSDRTVQRTIRRFVECGLLVEVRAARGRTPTIYHVRPEALGTVPEYHVLRAEQRAKRQAPPGKGPDDDRQGDFLSANPGENVVPRSDDLSPNSVDNPVDNSVGNSARGDKKARRGDTRVSPEPESDTTTTVPNVERDASATGDNADGSRASLDSKRHTRAPPAPGRRRGPMKSSSSRPSPADCERLALDHDLPTRQYGERHDQFLARLNEQLGRLDALTRLARQLSIDRRRPGESLEDFDERVTVTDLKRQGHKALSPEEARRQALKRSGAKRP